MHMSLPCDSRTMEQLTHSVFAAGFAHQSICNCKWTAHDHPMIRHGDGDVCVPPNFLCMLFLFALLLPLGTTGKHIRFRCSQSLGHLKNVQCSNIPDFFSHFDLYYTDDVFVLCGNFVEFGNALLSHCAFVMQRCVAGIWEFQGWRFGASSLPLERSMRERRQLPLQQVITRAVLLPFILYIIHN